MVVETQDLGEDAGGHPVVALIARPRDLRAQLQMFLPQLLCCVVCIDDVQYMCMYIIYIYVYMGQLGSCYNVQGSMLIICWEGTVLWPEMPRAKSIHAACRHKTEMVSFGGGAGPETTPRARA